MKYDKKGFTVAELLIVVAIVGILVAISIPILNEQLEKAREAHDIATMRAAASAAIEMYYAGVHDSKSASDAGMSWNTGGGYVAHNAYAAYDPKTGKFYNERKYLPEGSKMYGKGTKKDGGTNDIPTANPNGAYCPTEDYRNAVVMVSIYPNANPARVDVYWKTNTGKNDQYVGGIVTTVANIPKYSLRYIIN